jgi:hypothetical protein
LLDKAFPAAVDDLGQRECGIADQTLVSLRSIFSLHPFFSRFISSAQRFPEASLSVAGGHGLADFRQHQCGDIRKAVNFAVL